MKSDIKINLCLLFCLLLAAPVFASGKIRALVLYKGTEGYTEEYNPFTKSYSHQFDSANFEFSYFNIEDSLPSHLFMQKYHSVISCYQTAIMENPEQYLEWLSAQILQKRKVIILGNMGAFSGDGKNWLHENVINRFYLLFGLEYHGYWSADRKELEVAKADSRFVNNIHQGKLQVKNYFKITSVHPGNESYCIIKRKDIPEGESHIMVKTPFGGMAITDLLSTSESPQTGSAFDIISFIEESLKDPIDVKLLPDKYILGLLKYTEDSLCYNSLIHRFAFRELLRLGYWTDYLYIDKGFPDSLSMKKYLAIVSWFSTPEMVNGDQYPDWLLEQITSERKVIIIGNYGAFKSQSQVSDSINNESRMKWWVDWGQINNFFYPFGLEFRGSWTNDTSILRISYSDSSIVEKDIPLEISDVKHYYNWRSVHPDNRIFLSVKRLDHGNSESALVVRTPYGGMAFEGYIMTWNPTKNLLEFRLNLYEFLKDCLNYQAYDFPSPLKVISHDEILGNINNKDELLQKEALESQVAVPEAAVEFQRQVLILYKGNELDEGSEDDYRTPADVILNYLGMLTENWDIQDGLPDDKYMERFAGIISWFSSPMMHKPKAYSNWLIHQIESGRKVIIFDDYGAYIDSESEVAVADVKPLFSALGLRYWDTKVYPQQGQKIIYQSEEMMNFENSDPVEKLPLQEKKITSESPNNEVFLSIEDKELGRIDAVVTTPYGGIVLNDIAFIRKRIEKTQRDQLRSYLQGDAQFEQRSRDENGYWRINPFLFFEKVFNMPGKPIPDLTTLTGNRIFYSHIDGDGFTGVSRIDRRSYASEFVRDSILKVYPLPFTASVITSEIENKGFPYYNRARSIAKEIFKLKNIEPATHTYSHPYSWFGSDIDISKEKDAWQSRTKKLDYNLEMLGSIGYIEKNLAPAYKEVKVFLWSGRCNPDERALGYLSRHKLLNMNGGDPIYDSRYPSYSNLAPYAKKTGEYWQNYSSASNDFIYTTGWTRDFKGMGRLTEHFDYTESPQRILPLNIYFHYFIGDRNEGIQGLRKALDYCMSQKIAPMFTSDYLNIVSDFTSLRIFALPDSGFMIRNQGYLRTIRFDDNTSYPDLGRSKGIIGFSRHNNSIYIHLNEDREHIIYLQDSVPKETYLKHGSHQVSDWDATGNGVSFGTMGTGKAGFEIENLDRNSRYSIRIINKANSYELMNAEALTDAGGHLQFDLIFPDYQGQYSINITGK